MLEKIIRFSIAYRWLMLLFTFILAIVGIYNYQRLPIDAVPDVTNVQVQINTEATGFSPYETEQQITFPIETIMSGLPALDYTRSISRYGLSQVTIVFKNGTNIYFARQLVNERLQEIKNKLPTGIQPTLGPIATGLGEIFMYTVRSKNPTDTSMDLRTIQDWIIKPRLRQTPGVAEVNAVGGFIKQYHVIPDAVKLLQYRLSLQDIVTALTQNNANAGAGYIERNGEQYLIQIPGQIKDVNAINNIVVATRNGIPISIKDVATVGLGKELRTGAATENGEEVVMGTVFMLVGENSRIVSENVNKKLEEINKTLPEGMEATAVYNRMNLVNATIRTVKNNLFEGAVLVCILLFLFLRNIYAALITAAVIPLSMLLTITGMVHGKISANLMSLGALDFGLIVDGAVIIVENCLRRFEQDSLQGKPLEIGERLSITEAATCEVIRPSIFGVFIITIVYLPILTLQGVEQKMFLPMAQTVIIALLSSLLFSLTFVPAAIAVFLSGNVKVTSNRIMQVITEKYENLLNYFFKHRVGIILISLGLVLGSLLLAFNLGAEFMPSLDEGDITLHALRLPGTSLSQAVQMQHLLEKQLKQFPEVKTVFAKLGTAEVATDPMPPSVADTFIMLKPRNQWPNPRKPKAELIREMETAVNQIPGNNYEFTQPIQMRFNELLSGVRSDVAVKIFGDDLSTLINIGKSMEKILQPIPGAADVKLEPITGLPLISIEIDRQALARYGLQLANVQDSLKIAMAGQTSGKVFEGDKRFDIIVRLSENVRSDPEVLRRIFVPLPKAENGNQDFIPLSEIAKVVYLESPNQINRENGKRRMVVTTNVRGRDLSSFIAEAKEKINNNIKLPQGYWISWGGQFEQLESASKRLTLVIPLTLVAIFLLLFSALKNIKDAILVFTGIPLALTGGTFALWVRGIPLSISAGVGFIALSGIAVLNGLVMVTFIKKLTEQSDLSLQQAIFRGSVARLRPVLITALVASFGFIPMAIATGAGSEVQRPLATVVIGGIISSTVLTLLVLPGLYFIAHSGPSIRDTVKNYFTKGQ